MERDDPLSDVLSLLKPKAYGFRGLDVGNPWSLHLPPGRFVRCYAVLSGACALWIDGIPSPTSLVAGDFIFLPHGEAIVLGSHENAPPIDLAAFFTVVADGEIVLVNGGGACLGFGGYFDISEAPTRSLLGSLPSIVHLRGGEDHAGLRWFVERLMGELRHPRPGSRLIAEHLCQTLFIEALRLHIAAKPHQEGGWLSALIDPQLSRAISAIHTDNGRRWTVTSLARIAGMSRSSFAARFASAVGEPAISYVTRWRMLLAADRLSRRAPIEEVARDLGYGSPSAFGAAFRRTTGTSPRRYTRPAQKQENNDL